MSSPIYLTRPAKEYAADFKARLLALPNGGVSEEYAEAAAQDVIARAVVVGSSWEANRHAMARARA